MGQKVRAAIGALAAVFACTLAGVARADDPPKKEDPRPDDIQKKKEDIERRLYGSDREARSAAAKEALILEKELGEDFWIKLIDTRFPTVEEQEEAWHYAAEGLLWAGTPRSFP